MTLFFKNAPRRVSSLRTSSGGSEASPMVLCRRHDDYCKRVRTLCIIMWPFLIAREVTAFCFHGQVIQTVCCKAQFIIQDVVWIILVCLIYFVFFESIHVFPFFTEVYCCTVRCEALIVMVQVDEMSGEIWCYIHQFTFRSMFFNTECWIIYEFDLCKIYCMHCTPF